MANVGTKEEQFGLPTPQSVPAPVAMPQTQSVKPPTQTQQTPGPRPTADHSFDAPSQPKAPAAPPPAPGRSPQSPPQAGPVAGPTNFVDFSRYMGANAGAAQHGVQQLTSGLDANAAKAQSALAGSNDHPTADTAAQFAAVQQQRDALGSEGGIQSSLGGGATGFDAGLVGAAGQGAFQDEQNKYAGFDKALNDSIARGAASDRATADKQAAGAATDNTERKALTEQAAYQKYVEDTKAANQQLEEEAGSGPLSVSADTTLIDPYELWRKKNNLPPSDGTTPKFGGQ